MNKRAFYAALVFAVCATPVFAAGGLDEGTNALNDFRMWLYGFLGIGSLGYIAYNCGMAMMEKQQWNDVVMAVGKTAGAGGSVAVADYAWRIWGS